MTGQVLDNVTKEKRRHSLFMQGDDLDDTLDQDFSELWEDATSKQVDGEKDNIQEEVTLKLNSSLSSFHDYDPDTMFECFDMEEMSEMIESGEHSDNENNQATSEDQVTSCESLPQRLDETLMSQTFEETTETSTNSSSLPVCRKPNRSASPPRKRHASEKMRLSHSAQQTTATIDLHGQNRNCFDENQYQTLLRNLAASMRRTEITRAQVVQIQQNFRRTNSNSQNGSNSSLSAFFSGSRSTLTNGLEQSRQQLQGYMSQMKHCTGNMF